MLMRYKNIIATTIALISLTSCANDPKADGEKAAKLVIEVRDANIKYGYGSEEVKAAGQAADKFNSECQKKYGDNPEELQIFMDGFNNTLKEDMQKTQ